MKLPVFKLEEYLGEREFTTEIMFCGSDMETVPMAQLLSMADPEMRGIWNGLTLGYTEPKGHPLLLSEIGKLYRLADPSRQVCTFAGAEEAIYATMNVLLAPNDHVIVVTPGYQSLSEIPKAICAVTEVGLTFDSGQILLDVGAIERAVQPNTKLIVVSFPHNPTGFVMELPDHQRLVDLARKRGIYIFSDEVYRGLEQKSERRLPAIVSAYEKGISLGVLSKTYGMAGLRVGWIASRDEALLNEVGLFKNYLSICNSAPSEILAIIALRAAKPLVTRNLGIASANLEKLRTFFREHEDVFEWFEPQGGCVAFPRLKTAESSFTFADDLRRREGVLVLPGNVFAHSGNHFRVSFGRANMPEALIRVSRFLKNRTFV